MSDESSSEQVDIKRYVELGSTGLKRFAGTVDEEFLIKLRGRRAVKIFREMRENDPVVGALIFSVDMLLRNVTWRVEPASQDFEDIRAAVFVEECMDDMSHTWDELISEILSMLIYGWSYHEVVYKRRMGDVRNPQFKSKFADGMIGWRKMPIRAQETLLEWKFKEDGSIAGLQQMAPPTYKKVFIPIGKSLLFRTTSHKNNPEGRSVLRNAYRPWYFKKRIEEIEGIGIERDLAGLPVAKIPAEYLAANASDDEKAIANAFKKLVRNVRRDEQEGIVLPQAFDHETGKPLYEFELLNSGGSRSLNTSQIIERYEQRIAQTILADFILLGHEQVGSYALSVSKIGIFRTSLNAWARAIAEVFNRHEIPRLFGLNGWKLSKFPTLMPSEVDPPDLNELGNFISTMTGAGMTLFPDNDLEEFVRDAAKLPQKSPEVEMQQKQKEQEDKMREMEMMEMQGQQPQQFGGLQ